MTNGKPYYMPSLLSYLQEFIYHDHYMAIYFTVYLLYDQYVVKQELAQRSS